MIAEHALCREARRIFRKLLGEDRSLVRMTNGKYLVHRGARPESSHSLVAQDVVAGLRARDWLVPLGTVPESYRLSETGAAWLRRSEAGGDPYAAQHRIMARRVVVDPDGVEREAAVNEAESILLRLKARKLIGEVQCEAGERLRRDYTIAQLSPRLGVDLTQPMMPGRRGQKPQAQMADTVLAAKQRFAAAMAAAGPGLSDLLYDVCCAMTGLEDAERQFGWPARAGKIVLALALDRLALHYGLAVLPPMRARMRSWKLE